jgi:hypothetical protein
MPVNGNPYCLKHLESMRKSQTAQAVWLFNSYTERDHPIIAKA